MFLSASFSKHPPPPFVFPGPLKSIYYHIPPPVASALKTSSHDVEIYHINEDFDENKVPNMTENPGA
jgi:hypothetical protein